MGKEAQGVPSDGVDTAESKTQKRGGLWLHRVKITNFRLLADVELVLEDQTTVIVGRNNSGKTSLSEVMRRLLGGGNSSFQLEDFSSACCDGFGAALAAHNQGLEENVIRALIPAISLTLVFRYDPDHPELGALGPFVIDLDPACSEAVAVIRYELKDGAIADFFADLPQTELTDATRLPFFRALRERIPAAFAVKIWAEDPGDPENRKLMPPAAIRSLVKTGFINAQRGLDDITSRETDVLAKVLEGLFTTASSATADAGDRLIADALKSAVQDIQDRIDADFSSQLKSLIPTFQTFGYPGLGGPELQTETTLDVRKLLSNFTKIRYAGYGGITLPESYNGLGARNLIFILLQLVGFYRAFRAELAAPGVHIIFVEEPEAHLHPQMQEVFIRQLAKIAKQLNVGQEDTVPWPVQFVVSTHSSHVANAAGFETIRYFLAASGEDGVGARQTKIKDLRVGLSSTPETDRTFLRQYLTLTRCDLFFADKAALVEGLSERLLLPVIIRKLEAAEPEMPRLSSQYITVMEVGGAYAHLFFDLLDFLELRCLVVTDLDAVTTAGGKSCAVHEGTATSNACLKAWFAVDGQCTLDSLMAKGEAEKIRGRARIAYQRPEVTDGPCGRTFEDAFILANAALFSITGTTRGELELSARELASTLKKSAFALKYAISETKWSAPGYLVDGVRWLAVDDVPIVDPPATLLAQSALPPASTESHD